MTTGIISRPAAPETTGNQPVSFGTGHTVTDSRLECAKSTEKAAILSAQTKPHGWRCPLPPHRALRASVRVHRAERKAVAAWLTAAGWTYSDVLEVWRDPIGGSRWSIERATGRQATREAQNALAVHGYRLVTGVVAANGSTWAFAGTVRSPKGRVSGPAHALKALEAKRGGTAA